MICKCLQYVADEQKIKQHILSIYLAFVVIAVSWQVIFSLDYKIIYCIRTTSDDQPEPNNIPVCVFDIRTFAMYYNISEELCAMLRYDGYI